MKEAYAEQIEYEKQIGISGWRESLVHSIVHDTRHESVMIFARNSGSRFPTDSEFQEMVRLTQKRESEIRSVVNALDWF